MQEVVELVDPQAGRVADGDVGLGHAHHVHQLIEQRDHELRRLPDRGPACIRMQLTVPIVAGVGRSYRELEVVRLILMKIFSPGW